MPFRPDGNRVFLSNSKLIPTNALDDICFHGKPGSWIPDKLVLQLVCLLLERNLLIGSACQEAADIALRKPIEPEMLVLNCVHQFMK